MAQELSPYKVTRIIQLYFQGYTQMAIANKLGINQSTVSLYISRFSSTAEQYGLEVATRGLGIMDEVRSFHNLAAELKKNRLSVEEARIGLRIHNMLQRMGVAEDDFEDLILSVTKMKSDEFLHAAVELARLERNAGMNYEEVGNRFRSAYEQLQTTENKLEQANEELVSTKTELANTKEGRKLANRKFKADMKKIGVDTKRLQKVEKLALALKKAGIKDSELENYINRQMLLDKYDIALDTLTAILKEARVSTAHDEGKELITMLSVYGGLAQAIKGLEATVNALENDADGLEQKVELKKRIEDDIAKKKAERAALEKDVTNLSQEKRTLVKVQEEVKSLTKKKSALEQDISEKEGRKESLHSAIGDKEQQLHDLKELELRKQSISAELDEIEGKLEQRRPQLEIVDSFVGFINSPSFEETERFISVLPSLLAKAKEEEEHPTLLRDYILEKTTGGKLRALLCTSCDAKFAVDKAHKDYVGYYCPICGLALYIEVIKDEATILNEALSAHRQRRFVPIRRKSGAQ